MKTGLPEMSTSLLVDLGPPTRVAPEQKFSNVVRGGGGRGGRGAVRGRQRSVGSEESAKIPRETGLLNFIFRAQNVT